MPLSPHCNPLSASLEQPRCFPQQATRFLASFAAMVSTVNSRGIPGRETVGGYDIHHNHARQATLHTALCSCAPPIFLHRFRAGGRTRAAAPHRIAGFILHRRASINRVDVIGAPRIQVSTAGGSVLHAIEARPRALTSSIHPKLGVRSKHQRLHRYALLRIFRPVLGIVCAD